MVSIQASTTPHESTAPTARLGGTVHHYRWQYESQEVAIAYETLGQGAPVLLLPAFSTVSTRTEMAQIAQVLSPHFQVIALDWLGFGDSDRPALQYGRSLYQQILQDFVQACCPQPLTIIAAGHAAGYALHLAHTQPDICQNLILVAPTWKGPLRAMGAPTWMATGVRNLVRSPLLGPTLYSLNTRPAFLKWMYQRHVYVDHTKLTPTFMEQRYRITQHEGARFAPAAFVTGGLDPMADQDEWLHVGREVATSSTLARPMQVILADQSPPQSKAGMEAIASLPHVQAHRLPGSLGVYEEYGNEVGAIALQFLQS